MRTNISRSPTLTAITFTITLCMSTEVLAKSCATPSDVIQAAQMTITRINARTDRLELTLVETLKLHAGQVSAYITQQTTAIGRMFDAQNQSNAQIAREEAQVSATRDYIPSSNACETTSGVMGLQSAHINSDETAYKATAAQVNRLTNSKNTPAQNGQAQDVAIRWERRLEKWCSSEKLIDGKGICSGDVSNHNADLNPYSLFGKNTLETSTEQQAARDFITNLLVPVAPDPLPLKHIESDGDRRAHIKRLSAQSRLGLATSVLNASYAERLPSVNLGEWARALLPERTDIPDNISLKELNSVLMRERYENPNYHISLQAMEPANLLREQVSQQALMLSQIGRMSDWVEMLASVEAARLSIEVENEMRSKKAHSKTTSFPGISTEENQSDQVSPEQPQ